MDGVCTVVCVPVDSFVFIPARMTGRMGARGAVSV